MKKAGRETASIESDVCHFHHLALKKAPQPTPSFPHVIRNVIQKNPLSMGAMFHGLDLAHYQSLWIGEGLVLTRFVARDPQQARQKKKINIKKNVKEKKFERNDSIENLNNMIKIHNNNK